MFHFDNHVVPSLCTNLPGPKAAALLQRDEQFVSPSYTRVYPLVVARGSGAVVEDVDGNLFLDFTAGIAVNATGHCHPAVVAAIQDQAANLIHMSGTDFYYAPEIDLAEKLATIAPGPSPKRVFFGNSGAEAIEAALKLARYHTGRNRVVSFFGSFHGRTYGAMSLSASKLTHRRGFSPLVPDIHHVSFPESSTECGMRNAECGMENQGSESPGSSLNSEFRIPHSVLGLETLLHRTAPPDEVAAIFVEVIQGEGGYRMAPPGFLRGLRDLCDRNGIMMVVDEVQSGMGRTGKMFAIEYEGIEPDIICLAKGIASGMPLGAIVAKADVMDWPPGAHASTFGGNPVACRAALATIELLEGGYIANAYERGLQLREQLTTMCHRYACLRNVRGLGLMTAVDAVDDGGRPDAELRERIVQSAFHRGLLLLGCGESALRFCPPLCITEDQVTTGTRILDAVLTELARPGQRAA